MKIQTRAFVTALIALGVAAPSQASLLFTIKQNGSDVDAVGSGTVNMSGLTLASSVSAPPQINASLAALILGKTFLGESMNQFTGIAGPSAFGTGSWHTASSGSGNSFEVFGYLGYLGVPNGYTSGTQLNGTGTWTGQTLSSLGLTPGTYTWTWGSGADADSATLTIGDAPEPATLALFAAGLAGLARARRQRRGTV